ncbi:MAG TPA: hypothetical protein VK920_05350 [Solirubrobacterales bacterium]|nr:hypothetical protein [Solirubrobacterales bacterium]
MGLLDEVLEAHGGLERWRAARRVRARVRSGGLLLRTRVPGTRFADYLVTAEVGTPRSEADPFPREGNRAVFDAGSVRIEDDAGETVSARANPRPQFFGRSGLRRNLRWDALDAAYFAGYAMWNYLTTPYLLTREGVEASEGEPWSQDGETWRRLEVVFPPGLDTHSAWQTFYFGDRNLLRRHDYVAEVVGGWAHGAHYCADHVEAGGLVFPTRRWVRPIGPGNRSLPFPTMVWLELSEIEVEA